MDSIYFWYAVTENVENLRAVLLAAVIAMVSTIIQVTIITAMVVFVIRRMGVTVTLHVDPDARSRPWRHRGLTPGSED